MLESAENLIMNFILMIETYGMIPNGFRQYFLNRSQPPLFALMVKDLSEAFIAHGQNGRAQALEERAFHSLVQEHEFFMKTHSKLFKLKSEKEVLLNYYNAETVSPRPESYREDMLLVEDLKQ